MVRPLGTIFFLAATTAREKRGPRARKGRRSGRARERGQGSNHVHRAAEIVEKIAAIKRINCDDGGRCRDYEPWPSVKGNDYR